MRNRLVDRLLRKNTSVARIAGFLLSNFIGLAIIMGGIQFYCDARDIWEAEDSFVRTDYLVINKKVTSANTLGGADSRFSEAEISDISAQPWVRKVGRFMATDYQVSASVDRGGRGMSTMMFFESIPGEFVDVADSQWTYRPGVTEVPIIIAKDYLALYNFGFAGASGLPQMSESIMSGIPLRLRLRSDDGTESLELTGRVVGFSNRLNTVLVPQEFMEWSNSRLGSGEEKGVSRLIIDVSSPGDVAINEYLDAHSLEVAGDKSGSSASFLLKVVTGIILAVGAVITLLSFFILLLSISLLMEKNRDKLHSLLMLGYPLPAVGAPYRRIVALASVGAFLLALCGVWALRGSYADALAGLGASGGNMWTAPLAGAVLTVLIIVFNLMGVRRKVRSAWRV